jgi:plastocyanin
MNMKRKNVIIGAVIVVVVAIALTLMFRGNGKTTPTAQPAPASATVQITSKGFVPATLSVKQGTKVVWVNQDAKPHQVAADPYPDHSSLPGLFTPNPLASEETYSYTFTTAGSWTYHDQLHPTVGGVVVVK